MSEVITDAKGRKITTRKMNVLEQVKLLRAIGPDQSKNEPYVNLVMMAASVSAIDGIPMMVPTNERQIDGAISTIGDEGFAALMVDVRRQLDELTAAAEAAANGEAAPVSPLAPSA